MNKVNLFISGISASFDSFGSTDVPRTIIHKPTVEFSVNGNPNIGGSLYEPKYMWNINGYSDELNQMKLQAIWYESDRLRRALTSNYFILLEDYTSMVVEKSPRTRALANGSNVIDLGNGFISYYARFWSVMSEPPSTSVVGNKKQVTFTLTETIKVAA